MNISLTKTALVAIASLISFVASAGNYGYKGTTDTKVMGKEEVQNDLVLNVTETENGISFSMTGYEILGYKNISITGTAVLDENGKVVGWDKIVIKGAPAKVKDITGTLGKTSADIRMTGKAGGMFNFDIHYTAKKL